MTDKLLVLITKSAATQINEASAWWRKNRTAAQDAIADEIERAPDILSVQPSLGTRAKHARLSGVRRVRLSRINYFLYFRVSGGILSVLAL